MHLSRIVLVALAAYASGAVARPRPQEVRNARGLRFGKRSDNTSSSSYMPIGTSSPANQPQTTVSLNLTMTSDATPAMESTASSESLQTSVPTTPTASSTIENGVSTDSSSSSTATLSSSSSLNSSSTSTSPSATATAQVFSVPGGTYSTVGCYTDAANVGFPLIGAIKASDTSTASQCLNTCASPSIGGPYVYAGVEGTECFCSNSFDSAAPQSPGACTSNLMKRAGGSITLYQFNPTTSTVSSSGISTSPTSSVISSQSTETIAPSVSPLITTTSNTVTTQTLSETGSITLPTAFPGSPVSTTQPSMSSPTPTQGGNGQPPPQPNQQPPPLSEQGYTVVAGDTLSSIAQALGISLSELEAINNQIPNKDDIQVGQVINVPSNSPQNTFVYTVVAGDTLSDIAQAFGTSLSALEALNHQIQNQNLIFPGQLITVPLSSQQNIFVYTIAAGDTLSDIALQFGTSLSALEALNHQIKYPDLIFPGQVIAVPT